MSGSATLRWMAATRDEIQVFLAEQFPGASTVECVEVGSRHAVARWIYEPSGLRPGNLISGPTQFMLADTALYFAVFGAIGIEPMAVTADLAIRFLRPAKGGDLFARADLLHLGAARVYGEVDLWVDGDADRRVSHATGTYSLPPAKRT